MKILSTILAAALCLTPEVLNAATQQSTQPSPPAQTQQQSNDQNAAQPQQTQPQSDQQNGTTVDPTKAPLQPVTTYPDAPTPQQDQEQTTTKPVTTTTEPAPQEPQKPPSEPVGAAAAEKAKTAGGAASKPAGAAIAPAKQHQTRSLLIKIGAIAAGGLAAGTVYALSRSSPSKPPGTNLPGATQK